MSDATTLPLPEDLAELAAEADGALAAATDLRAWDAVRVGLLGKSGRLTGLLKALGQAAPEQRRERGASLNRLKDRLTLAVEGRRLALEAAAKYLKEFMIRELSTD